MPHTLPDLPYAYEALEPHIDAQTMRLHHDLHHKSYVDGLNNAEAKLAAARESGDLALTKHWSREAAFHGSGHLNHVIFWNNMKPNGGGQPGGDLADALNKNFGDFAKFKAHFTAAAVQVEGSGWAVLAHRPLDGALVILQSEKHQQLTQWGVRPVLMLDVWEHAYYLKYQNKRAAYVEAWWNVVNWDDAAKNLKG